MGVHGSNGGNDVVLRGFYCWFRGADPVATGLRNLDGNMLGCNKLLDDAGLFVVEDVEGWLVALLFEFGVYALEYCNHTCIFS